MNCQPSLRPTRPPLEPGERAEVSATQQEDGRWVAIQYYRDHSGAPRRGKATRKTETAAKKAARANVDKALAVGGGVYKPSTRFEVAVTDYLEEVRALVERGSRSPTTYDAYVTHAEKHVIPAIGVLRLSELTTGRLDAFLTKVHRTKGYSTAKTCRTVLSGTCGLLVRRDVLRVNPVRDVGRIEQGRKKAARALSESEVHTFLDMLDESEYAKRKDLPDLLRLLFATGVRIGEALALRWCDVNLATGVIVFDGTIVYVKGVGLVRKTTKSVTSDRILQVPDWCRSMLADRYVGQDLAAPVFPNAVGTWRDRSNVGRDIRKVRGKVFGWLTSHTARKTVATVLDERGMTARQIADQLGHARPSMTQDVYMGRKVTNVAADHLDRLVPKARETTGKDDNNPDQKAS